MLVHVGQSEHGLVHDAPDVPLRELGGAILHELVNILFHVFKHEVQVVVHADDFFEFDDLGMVELAERFDLAKGHALLP